MARILVTRRLPPAVEAEMDDLSPERRDSTIPLTVDECAAALRDYDAILPTLGDAFSAEAFAKAGDVRCRTLANFGVGYNHIDVAAARAAGVTVTNTPGAVTDATADTAMTLLLMSARRAAEGERLVRKGEWTGWHPTQMLGNHVTGKHLGVVGMGRIGEAIARRCHYGFGMRVSFFNRSRKTPEVPCEQVADLLDLMSAVDFVVVAVPGGAETRHLIGATEIAAMQPHAHLVNIARGDVIDEAALIDALERGAIAGAGLDVYEREPEVPERLRALDNVTLLPHLGTAVLEVREAMGRLAVENLRACLAGEVPPNPV